MTAEEQMIVERPTTSTTLRALDSIAQRTGFEEALAAAQALEEAGFVIVAVARDDH